jgi:hypothetical protein
MTKTHLWIFLGAAVVGYFSAVTLTNSATPTAAATAGSGFPLARKAYNAGIKLANSNAATLP